MSLALDRMRRILQGDWEVRELWVLHSEDEEWTKSFGSQRTICSYLSDGRWVDMGRVLGTWDVELPNRIWYNRGTRKERYYELEADGEITRTGPFKPDGSWYGRMLYRFLEAKLAPVQCACGTMPEPGERFCQNCGARARVARPKPPKPKPLTEKKKSEEALPRRQADSVLGLWQLGEFGRLAFFQDGWAFHERFGVPWIRQSAERIELKGKGLVQLLDENTLDLKGLRGRRLLGLVVFDAEKSHFSPDEEWLWLEKGSDSWVLDRDYNVVLSFKDSQGFLCRNGRASVTRDGVSAVWDLRKKAPLTAKVPGVALAVGAERLLFQTSSGYVVRDLESSRDLSLGVGTLVVFGEELGRAVLQDEQRIRAFCLASGRELWQREVEGRICLNSDETMLALQQPDRILVLDAIDGREVSTLECPGELIEMKWAGPTLLAGCRGENTKHSLFWWHKESWGSGAMRVLEYGETGFSPYSEADREGRRLLVLQGQGRGDDDSLLSWLWFRNGTAIDGFVRPVTNHGQFARLSPDGRWMAVNYRYGGDIDQTVVLYHCSGRDKAYIPVRFGGWMEPRYFGFDADSCRLRVDQGRSVLIWSLAILNSDAPPEPRFGSSGVGASTGG